uniref:SRR1 domain containing n=1 Tax=Oryctolagus cuniculus TaxID=9986 RepID=G1SQP7_RABIT
EQPGLEPALETLQAAAYPLCCTSPSHSRHAAVRPAEWRPLTSCSLSHGVSGLGCGVTCARPLTPSGAALPDTVNRCLTKHREQLEAPVGSLSGALGRLHLAESAVAPGSAPADVVAPGACQLKCVCYGLGSFATCVVARNQLAFLLLLLEKCQIPRSHCWVYDPLFSPLEIAVLNRLGVAVLSENEEGKRSVAGEPTLFYMVHCGTALYNNLLWRNWSVDALSKMLIIGNSFTGLQESLCVPMFAQVLKGLEELEFAQTAQYVDTFNDTAVHWFPVQKLQQLSTEVWTFREEPEYQDCEDLEIIRKERRKSPQPLS